MPCSRRGWRGCGRGSWPAAPLGVTDGAKFCWRLPEPGDAAAQVRRERLVVLRRERLVVLYGPIRLVTELAVLWTVAALLFAFVNLQFGPRLGTQVGETILLGGVGHPGVFLAEQQEARTG